MNLLTHSYRQTAHQVLNFLLVFSSALGLWKGLSVLTNCESPIVVVLSESMEPAFARGDLLFLAWTPEPVVAGDIPVFRISGRDIPIVHRAIEVHTRRNDSVQMILTKGDNNMVDDRGLYNPGQLWIQREDLMGRVVGFLPYVGMVTILLNDYPQLKVALLVVLALMALLSKEDSYAG